MNKLPEHRWSHNRDVTPRGGKNPDSSVAPLPQNDNSIKNQAIPTLNIEGLTVAYRQNGRWLDAVRDVSLHIQPGEIYGLVGESGSGKTTLALAVLRYLGQNGMIRRGKIELNGRNLLGLQPGDMRKLWGREVAYLPQNPQSALNPTLQVGDQVAEILHYQLGMERMAAWRRAVDSLREVNIADPERVASSYPHQLSGGMQQRALIAMALCSNPTLLILDEPTTNLDVTTQASILELLVELIRQRQTAVLYITHNLAVVAQMCQRVGVMYAGVLLEEASAADLFARPLHPYTQGLLNSLPRLGEGKRRARLQSIAGQLPAPGERPLGCVFQPRCPLAIEICSQNPALSLPSAGRRIRCHRWEAIGKGEISLPEAPEMAGQGGAEAGVRQVALSLEGIAVNYPLRRTLLDTLRRKPRRAVRAVDKVDLEIASGNTFGLVGESGSGKTTLARAILGVVDGTEGRMELLGAPLPTRLSSREREELRRVQIIFQNSEEALNPHLTVEEILLRPLVTLLGLSRQEARGRVPELLAAVRLPPEYAWRLPTQLSGGEKQRVAIGRAFAARPDLLVCDEPVSALDVSVQASILNLLCDLQAEKQSSLLFISHDLAVVGYLADVIAVIYLGQLMEIAEADDLFAPPFHPYTEALLSAIPTAGPQVGQKGIVLGGEIPSPTEKPGGCPFHTRCPRLVGEICKTQAPPWQAHGGSSKRYRCHIPWTELQAAQGGPANGKKHTG